MPLPYNALVVVRRGGILPALDEFMNNVFRAGKIRPLQNALVIFRRGRAVPRPKQ